MPEKTGLLPNLKDMLFWKNLAIFNQKDSARLWNASQ